MSALPHGGDLAAFRKAFPNAALPVVDLSTGINPHAYSASDFTLGAAQRLPGAEEHRALLQAFADYASLAPEIIMAVPGSQAAISLLPHCFEPSTVAIVSPTYNEHGSCWRRAGHQVLEAGLETGLNARPHILVLVNPNNPTGECLDRNKVTDLLGEQEARGGYLIIDEAFIDTMPDESVCDLVAEDGHLIVLRSFGKFFGLAGLRLGFCIAPETQQRTLQEMLGPWPIATPTLEIATRAYQDAIWIKRMRMRLRDEAARWSDLIRSCGLNPIGGTQLFQLCEHKDMARIANELGKDGIYVRTFPAHPGWARLGLPADEAQWARIEASLRKLNLPLNFKGDHHG